jgi:hypothetical protein
VVALIDGVVNDVVPEPPASTVPPVAAAYQSIVCPPPGVADNVTVPVPQRDEGVPVGAMGSAFTVAVVEPAALVQPLTVTVTEYVPDCVAVAEPITGFCVAEVNPPGPVHAYVAPATAGTERFKVEPAQIGPLFVGAGVAGIGFTVTVTGEDGVVHPVTSETVTE